MRAYVTGGDRPPVTTRAGSTVHARYGRTAVPLASSWLVADKRSEGPRGMHRTLAAISGVGLGGRPATPALLCRHHRLQVATLRAAGDAMVPVVLTGTRGRNNESAHGHRAAPATLRLHPTYRSCVKRRIGTPLRRY